jgi:hypothetical protein
MPASIGRVELTVRAASHASDRAALLARDVRSALPAALTAAAAAADGGVAGVVLVPRVNVSMNGALRRLRGEHVARTLARACIDAVVERSSPLRDAAGEDDGRAQCIVDTLRSGESVRCASRAEAAAAWLVASSIGEPGMLLSLPPFADLRYRSSGAAFAQVCERVNDAGAVIGALGRRWSERFAALCSEADARSVLRMMANDDDPDAETWTFLAGRLAASAERDAGSPARRLLSAAIAGRFEGRAGIAAAARSMLASPRRAAGTNVANAMASDLCGIWLLWRRLGPLVDGYDEREARAVALALGERLGGSFAAGDPALAALCCDGESLRDLRAAAPRGLHVERLTVAVIRDFARGLTHFERARCGYVLRAILSGPGEVTRTADGWSATLPHSPLRVVLERASLLGPVAVPWESPRLTLVPDDE